ncbi:unnamed protein product, partial [Durusdinium trenchii]
GALRPKAPLRIPCFLCWSEEDDSKQFSNYEDLALYIHPKFRRICLHGQGHRPPNLQKNTKELETLDSFIGSMQSGVLSADADDDKPAAIYKGHWLPVPRESAPELKAGPLKLIVVPDPLGEHGPLPEQALKDRLRFPAQEPPELTAQRLSLFRQVTALTSEDFAPLGAVTGVKFQQADKLVKWHPEVKERDASTAYAVDAGRSRWLQAEDEVQIGWSQLEEMALKLLEENVEITPDDNVAVLGLGTWKTGTINGQKTIAVHRGSRLQDKRPGKAFQ